MLKANAGMNTINFFIKQNLEMFESSALFRKYDIWIVDDVACGRVEQTSIQIIAIFYDY